MASLAGSAVTASVVDGAAATDLLADDELDGKVSGKPKKKKQKREFDWTKATFRHYALKIAYVGTEYHGLAWQDPELSPNCPTVESKLFEALTKTCLIRKRSECSYSRCGRTDKG